LLDNPLLKKPLKLEQISRGCSGIGDDSGPEPHLRAHESHIKKTI